MKHKGKLLLLSVFLVAMLIPLFGCGSSSEESFDGALISVTDDTLIVGGDSEKKLFSTTDETAFDLGQ